MGANANATVQIKALLDASDVEGKVKQIQNGFKNIKLPAGLGSEMEKSFNNVYKALEKFQQKAEKGVSNNMDAKGIAKSYAEIDSAYNSLLRNFDKVQTFIGKSKNLSDIFKLSPAEQANFNKVQAEINQLKSSLDTLSKSKMPDINKILGNMATPGIKNQATEAIQNLKDYESVLNRLQQLKAKEEGRREKSEQGKTAYATSSQNIQELEKLINLYQQLQSQASATEGLISSKEVSNANLVANAVSREADEFNRAHNSAKQVGQDINKAGPALLNAANEAGHLGTELDMMKSRIQYFFGLNNAVRLFQNSIRQAFQTVKDLDAAMTETAVVTNFSVGDMWDQLDKYTKIANDLGATTKGAYETMTLFYQQGLSSSEAFQIGTETMKMARIAGLDYATATDYMTAALRGFNMELNETSAKRVNDVYSKLAAITASNTQEISVAMTKTASLASNANMEFETTSAYLSQIIETTRESAETAGTALKTVIARFTELKKDPALIENVDGEAVDANKIETALKSIGVALRDDAGQFRNLDDVFLDINQRWDSLTTNQQRYIATQAAGSRQQSRFIAMMSNYARTQELMDAAYNSSGASDAQFQKTLDSLESKLNQLTNAWNEFTMGIANSSAIKVAVDALTMLLNVINKLTNIKGIGGLLKVGLAASALGGFGRIANLGSAAIGGVLKASDKGNIGASITNAINKAMEGSGATSKRQYIARGFASPFMFMKGSGQGIKEWWNTEKTVRGQNAQGSLTSTPAAVTTNGKQLVKLLPKLGIAIAAVTAAVVVAKKLWNLTAGQMVKNAQKQANTAQTVAKLSQSNYEESKNNLEKYKQTLVDFSEATSSTERATLVSNINDSVLAMINSGYSGKIGQNQNTGALQIDEIEYQDFLKKQSEGAQQATQTALMAQANSFKAQAKAQQSRILQIKSAQIQDDDYTLFEKELKNAEAKQQANNAQAKNLYAAAIKNGLSDYSENISNEVANLMSSNMDSYANDIDKEKQLLKHTGIQQLKNEYLETFGVQADSTLDKDDLIDILSASRYEAKQQDSAKRIASLAEMNSNVANYIKNANNTEQNLLEMDDQSLSEFAQAQVEALGDSANILKKELGVSDLTSYLKDQLKLQQEQSKLQRTSIKASVLKNGRGIFNPSNTFDNYMKQLNALDAKQIAQMSSIISNAEGQLTTESLEVLYKELPQLTQKASQELNNLFNNINWDNAVDAYKKLTDYSEKYANTDVGNVAKEILTFEKESGKFTKGNLVQSFLTSNAYAQISDSVKDLIKNNGKLNSSNIEELADSCSDLNTLLEDCGFSASAMAAAITAVESGEAPLNSLTSRVMIALSAITSLDDAAAHMAATMKNFDAGQDLGEGIDWIDARINDLNSLVEGYELGNDQTYKLYDQLMGSEGSYAKLAESFGSDYDGLYNQIKRDIGYLDNIVNNDGQNILKYLTSQEAKNRSPGLEGLSVSNGTFTWEGITSAQQAIDAIYEGLNSELYHVSRSSAEIIFERLVAQSPDIRRELGKSELTSIIDTFSQNQADYMLGDKAYVNKSEIAAVAYRTAQDIDTVVGAFTDAGFTVVDWFSETGAALEGSKFQEKFKELTGQDLSNFLKTGDLLTNINALKQSGATDDQISYGLQQLSDGFYKMTYTWRDLQGQEQKKTFSGSSAEEVWQRYNEFAAKMESLDYTSALSTIDGDIVAGFNNLVGAILNQDKYDKARAHYNENLENEHLGSYQDDGTYKNSGHGSVEQQQAVWKDWRTLGPSETNPYQQLLYEYSSGLYKTGPRNEITGQFYDNNDQFTELGKQLINYATEAGLEGLKPSEVMDGLALEFPDVKIPDAEIDSNNVTVNAAQNTNEPEQPTSSPESKKAQTETPSNVPESIETNINVNNLDDALGTAQELQETISGVSSEASQLPPHFIKMKQESGETKANMETLLGVIQQTIAQAQTLASALETAGAGSTEFMKTFSGNEDWNAGMDLDLKGNIHFEVTHDPYPNPQNIKREIHYKVRTDDLPARYGKLGSNSYNSLPGFASGKNPTKSSIYSSRNWYNQNQYSGRGVGRNYEGIAQLGEEGPELILGDRGPMLAGINGPTFGYVYKNDRIFTATETKRLLRGTDISNLPGFFGGKGPGSNIKGLGSGAAKETDDFKNDFDKLYNLLEDIAELERIQDQWQDKYDNYLEDISKNGRELVQITREQLTNLYDQRDLNQQRYDLRVQEMQEYLAEKSDLSQYASYNFDDMTAEIDWDKINAVGDKDTMQKIKDYVSKIEKIQKDMDDAEKNIMDINNTVQEILLRQREDAKNFVDRVKEAVVNATQKQIDKLNAVNDSIQDTNTRVFDAINKAISKYRDDRENDESAKNIAKMERQLAYLQQDTSGNNQLEILQLQKDLDDARQDYTDTLIDQKLSSLQDAEDYAAEQREREISLMESQLEWAQESGALWGEVQDLLNKAIDPAKGTLLNETTLEELLKSKDAWTGYSEIEREIWKEELVKGIKQYFAYQEMGETIGQDEQGKEIEFWYNGEKMSGKVDNNGRIRIGDYDYGDPLSDDGSTSIRWNFDTSRWETNFRTDEFIKAEQKAKEEAEAAAKAQQAASGGGGSSWTGNTGSGGCSNMCQTDCGSACTRSCSDDCLQSCTNSCAQICGQNCGINSKGHSQGYSGASVTSTYNKLISRASGGYISSNLLSLLGEEGPEIVWNKSKGYSYIAGANGPQYGNLHAGDQVFTADETRDILKRSMSIRDPLSSFANGTGGSISTSGDNYFKIEIAATLENDYDVEKLTNKIKKTIYEDAAYRNVNVINRLK